MLRGHDHYLEGFKHYEKYIEYPILTLNTRCYHPETIEGRYSESLCVASWVKSKLPDVHKLPIPRKFLDNNYPIKNV